MFQVHAHWSVWQNGDELEKSAALSGNSSPTLYLIVSMYTSWVKCFFWGQQYARIIESSILVVTCTTCPYWNRGHTETCLAKSAILYHKRDTRRNENVKGWDHSSWLGNYNTEALRRHGRTGLCSALEDLVGEGSHAFTGNSRQREGVLSVGSQAFYNIRGPGLKTFLLLLAQKNWL